MVYVAINDFVNLYQMLYTVVYIFHQSSHMVYVSMNRSWTKSYQILYTFSIVQPYGLCFNERAITKTCCTSRIRFCIPWYIFFTNPAIWFMF